MMRSSAIEISLNFNLMLRCPLNSPL